MQTLPPDLVLPFAASLCAGLGMLVLGFNTKLLQRHRRICRSCGRAIQGARCGCVN